MGGKDITDNWACPDNWIYVNGRVEKTEVKVRMKGKTAPAKAKIATRWNERLCAVLTEKGITLRKAARLAGVAPSVMDSWSSGASPTDLQAVKRLFDALDLSFTWLLTGDGNFRNRACRSNWRGEITIRKRGAGGTSLGRGVCQFRPPRAHPLSSWYVAQYGHQNFFVVPALSCGGGHRCHLASL